MARTRRTCPPHPYARPDHVANRAPSMWRALLVPRRPPAVSPTRAATAGSPLSPPPCLRDEVLSALLRLLPIKGTHIFSSRVRPSTTSPLPLPLLSSPLRSLPRPLNHPNTYLGPHSSSPGRLLPKTRRRLAGATAPIVAAAWLHRASSPAPSPPHLWPQINPG
jgi:hypothetical protein